MKFKIKIGEKEYPIEIKENEKEVIITVGEKKFSFIKEKEIKIAQSFFPTKREKSEEVLAPIGGIINEIFVKEGDLVKEGQKLLILSAMKMENEICSEREGKIKKIMVKKGETVKKDQKLIEIE